MKKHSKHDEQFLIEFSAVHPAPEPQDRRQNEVFGPLQFGDEEYFQKYIAATSSWLIVAAVEPNADGTGSTEVGTEAAAMTYAIRKLPPPEIPEAATLSQMGDPFFYGARIFAWNYDAGNRSWKLLTQLG